MIENGSKPPLVLGKYKSSFGWDDVLRLLGKGKAIREMKDIEKG